MHRLAEENFGGKLAFYGGISPRRRRCQAGRGRAVRGTGGSLEAGAGSQGTGLLLGPSHRMMTDIPMENVEAMIEAFKRG